MSLPIPDGLPRVDALRMTVRLTGARPHKLGQVFRSLAANSDGGLRQACYRMAQTTAREVRQLYYQHGAGHKPSGISQMLRAVGKEKGANAPAKPPQGSPSSTMVQIGRNIQITPTGEKSGYYRVQVNREALTDETSSRYPFGRPLWKVADWIEKRIPTTWPFTLRMMGYLQTVRRGLGGFGTRKRDFNMPDRPVSIPAIVVTPPDMPVWSVVGARLKSLLPILDGELAKIVKRAIKSQGL